MCVCCEHICVEGGYCGCVLVVVGVVHPVCLNGTFVVVMTCPSDFI